MKRLASVFLLFVMCFALVGCGKNDEKKKAILTKEKAQEYVTALAEATKTYYLITIVKTNAEPKAEDYTLTNIKVDHAPSTVDSISVTQVDGVIEVTIKNAKFGYYYCQYNNDKAECS